MNHIRVDDLLFNANEKIILIPIKQGHIIETKRTAGESFENFFISKKICNNEQLVKTDQKALSEYIGLNSNQYSIKDLITLNEKNVFLPSGKFLDTRLGKEALNACISLYEKYKED
ncbi:MAG: hypothetical protein ACOYT4_04840 [Nanoarchaeota archaeon]